MPCASQASLEPLPCVTVSTQCPPCTSLLVAGCSVAPARPTAPTDHQDRSPRGYRHTAITFTHARATKTRVAMINTQAVEREPDIRKGHGTTHIVVVCPGGVWLCLGRCGSLAGLLHCCSVVATPLLLLMGTPCGCNRTRRLSRCCARSTMASNCEIDAKALNSGLVSPQT